MIKKYLNFDNIIIFLAATFFSLLFVNNLPLIQAQNSNILPFINKAKNPNLYPNDILAIGNQYIYSFSYYLPGFLARFFPPQEILYLFYFLENYLAFYSIFYFSYFIYSKKLVSYFVLFLMTFGGFTRYNLGSTAPIGSSVYSNLDALPILLFAFIFFMKKKYPIAFFLTGLAFNFHALYAAYTIIIFTFYFLYILIFNKRTNFKIYLLSFIVFLFSLIPFLLLVITHPQPSGNYLSKNELVELLRLRRPGHSFPFGFTLTQWVPFLTIVILWMVSFREKPKKEIHSQILIFTLAIFFMCLFGLIFVEFIPLTQLITLAPFRSTIFLNIFAGIYVSNYFLNILKKKSIAKRGFVIAFTLILLLINVNSFPLYRRLDFNNFPKIERYKELPKIQNWLKVQLWIKENTPYNQMIITPPYLSDFRSYSERSIIIDWNHSDLGVYVPSLGKIIKERLSEFCIKNFSDYKNSKEIEKALEKHYNAFTEVDFLRLAKKYNAQFLVTERGQKLRFPISYKNKFFTIYNCLAENSGIYARDEGKQLHTSPANSGVNPEEPSFPQDACKLGKKTPAF